MRGRILIVEDNDLNRDLVTRFLELFRFQTVPAVTGAQALEICRSDSPPDLVLMDVSLPDMDGCEATRQLKQDERTSRIPIIALTAHAMIGDRERCLAAGCDEYETKPIDFPLLVEKIESLLCQGVIA